jgi:hypothetical protein
VELIPLVSAAILKCVATGVASAFRRACRSSLSRARVAVLIAPDTPSIWLDCLLG